MYADTFPELNAKYHVDNFEIIAEAIEKHFSDIFKLDALNSEAAKSTPPGSYLDLFDACIAQFKDLYTVPEVVKKLHEILQSDETIKRRFLGNLVFVPSVGLSPSSQIGFLEKMATDTLKMAEPVTFIDMMRAVNGLINLKSKPLPIDFQPISVVHLNDLPYLDTNRLQLSNQALIINFNPDLKGSPKWGVVNLKDKSHPVVYCETALNEREKRDLEASLGVAVHSFIDAGANSLPSTGYTALAWLDNQITKASNFDVNGDFAALAQQYAFVQMGGDANSLTYMINATEVHQFCTPAFRRIASASFSDLPIISDITANAFKGGRALTLLGYSAVLGVLDGKTFRPGDIAAAIRISELKGWTNPQVRPSFLKAASTLLPSFSKTLARHRMPNLLAESGDTISLAVPDVIDMTCLNEIHVAVCKETGTADDWLIKIPGLVPRVGTVQEYIAVIMVLTLIRAMAKKRILEIHLPAHFILNPEEKKFVVATLTENAYITEFNVNGNDSLIDVRAQLISIFARNRWLAASGYRPPMIDDYWKQAARYWLLHLHEHPAVLEMKAEHDLFKRCVREMGLNGLNAVLEFLSDGAEQDLLARVYGQDRPAFYAGCQPDEMRQYLSRLIAYLRVRENNFPFSELGISYQEGNEALLVDLLGQINQLKRFEKITLTDFLKAGRRSTMDFIRELTRQAKDNGWVGLVVIPELEDKENTSDVLCELRSMYALLNDVILRNRHLQAAADVLNSIESCSNFSENFEVGDAEFMPLDAGIDEAKDDDLGRFVDHAFDRLQPGASWPLKKGGVVQLQLQQQQQIQQNRQIQQEQQRVTIHSVEEALVGELVDYHNIDRLLAPFVAEFSRENKVWEQGALLRSHSESLLEGFFHTWVNANPKVLAPYVIHQMTQDAAKALFRKHRLLPSGLNPDNLPKGFYTQRSKDGHLILCYNAELAFVNAPNPVTIDADVRMPEASGWDGDFRQFHLDKYLGDPAPLDAEDWQNIILFAQLQPPKDYSVDFFEFCRVNPMVSAPLLALRDKAIRNWPVFMQLWQYKGAEGLAAFLAKDELQLSMPKDTVRQLLLQHQSPAIQRWAESVGINEKFLCGLGQVYHRSGNKGLQLLLTKFNQLNVALGDRFFACFHHFVLSRSENFNCFMTEKFFATMDRMIVKLRPRSAHDNLQAWQDVLALHMEVVGWDNIDTLWQGFAHFIDELEQLGLALDGHEFQGMRPENMLMCMDRILESLKHIANTDSQKLFLTHLNEVDRTHGGVPYALKYDGFKYVSSELELYDFVAGTPTYAPDLKELYTWSGREAALKMQRTVASQRQFSHESYPQLLRRLGTDDTGSKDLLIWLLHTQYPPANITVVMEKIEALQPGLTTLIARHLHQAVYRSGNADLAVHLDAMLDVAALCGRSSRLNIEPMLRKYPHGTVLETLSLLQQTGRFGPASVEQLLSLMGAGIEAPDYLHREGYKLAALFAVERRNGLDAFYAVTASIRPVVQNELRLLITQLLSLDFATSNLLSLQSPENWGDLIATIEAMKADPAHTGLHRIALIEKLNSRELRFRYSKSGEFRALRSKDMDGPEGLDAFVDHEDRLWGFMQEHIAVPNVGSAQEALQPIVRLLKRLQLNRTYLNEIEPLLASLEKTGAGKYWSANYFYQLLRVLQPEDEQSSFPISLLKVMLPEESIGAKDIDSLQRDFPQLLIAPVKTVLNNKVFDRAQQALLCQIVLREYDWQGVVALVPTIMATLSLDAHAMSRSYVLDILAKCKSFNELETRFEHCRWLLQRAPVNAVVRSQWTKTAAMWLKAISAPKSEMALFLSIKSEFAVNPEKQALILHIIAWSSLNPGLKNNDAHITELSKKAPKLVAKLGEMDEASLLLLAKCYPQQPSPSADDILRLIKGRGIDGSNFSQRLDDFMRNPFPEARADFGGVAATREADLRRMIKATQVSRGEERLRISAKHSTQLTLILSYLKRLENGLEQLKGVGKAISEMSQDELAAAFQRLSRESVHRPNDDLLRAELWAVMFEVMGKTTRKYPHLAQQFALIANDLCLVAPSRVLQLATGEGKSHFVAMRAARHAGQGKVVDVCTAKRTLAARDLEDYQSFFSYLGLKTAYIHPKSTHETYMGSQIHYSTTGDLSLFLDEQSFAGHPINIPKQRRVGLFDEFDFIRDDEGRKTQYNYARPTGKTPKQMTWFYQAVNDFYQLNKKSISAEDVGKISKARLLAFAHRLRAVAGENEEKQNLIKQMLHDPLQLVQWLQSAHEAHALVWGIGFTVVDQNIEVGDEFYPMREIIPLSSDNQKMVGSTFSGGVQQLLAVRLNTEARLNHESQNFHIHPESHIISSQVAAQRMQELWGNWEGFSGTISPAQAAALYIEQRTEVLHVPTNQSDLRHWHKLQFYARDEERLAAIAGQLRHCLLHKESILFSCKNDKQVNELHELFRGLLNDNDRAILAVEKELQKLATGRSTAEDERRIAELGARRVELLAGEAMVEPGLLSRDEYASMMFYTNEEHRTASEVLADKHEQENWHGGKKQKGVCLVASGFGRGDNVDVEAVFLINVNDINDLLQKGGRTARNGEEGTVHQFYLPNELREEEAMFKRVLRAAHVDVDSLDGVLAGVVGDSEDERCFQRVMLLREYLFNLQNEANQGYYNAIARYSSWGMKYLGQINDHQLRENLTIAFSYHLKRLEKQWIDISSQQDTTTANKMTLIEGDIILAATAFTARYNDDVGAVAGMEFVLTPQVVAPVQLVVRRPINAGPVDHAVAVICGVLTHLPDMVLSDERVTRIPGLFEALAADDMALQRFAKHVTEFNSVQTFVDALEIAVEQVRAPSEVWTETHEAAEIELTSANFLEGVSNGELKLVFLGLMERFRPSIQTQIMAYLLAPSRTLTAEERILSILPVLGYLSTFTANEQRNWVPEYIDELDGLLHENSENSLRFRLRHSPPMRLSHLQGIWRMAERCAPESDADLADLLQRLGRAVKAAPEHRMRMLTKWESWSKGMSTQKASAFLMNFCQVMEQFKEGRDWDLFVQLVNKTQDWWNRETTGVYQGPLVELWARLAKNSDALSEIGDIIKWGTGQDGKSWFQLLSAHLTLAPVFEIRHRQQIEAVWAKINSQDMKKQEKTTSFNRCVHGLSRFYDAISSSEPSEYRVLVEQFSGLTTDRSKCILELLAEHDESLVEHPDLVATILHDMSDITLPIARVESIAQLLVEATKYKARYPTAVDDLTREFAKVRGALTAMPEDRFNGLIQLVSRHIETWFKYPQVLPQLLGYICDERFLPARAFALSDVLLNAVAHVETSPESIDYLISEFNRAKDFFIGVPGNKFSLMMMLTNDNIETWVKHPNLYQAIVWYMRDRRLSLERAEDICRLLINVANISQQSFDHLNSVFCGNWKKIVQLSDEKYNWLMVHLGDNVAIWSKFPFVLDELLGDLSDQRNISLAWIHSLSMVLVSAADLQERCPGTLEAMMRILADHRNGLIRLDRAKFQWTIGLMLDQIEVLLRYPNALRAILQFVGEQHLSLDRVHSLSQLLLTAVTSDPSPIDGLIALLVADDVNFIDLPDDKFQLLMALSKENLALFVKHKEVFSAIVRCMDNPRLSCRRIEMFSQLMIKAVNVSVENFTYLDDIFSRQWESIVQLSDAKYQWTIELIDKHLETWPNFAHALPAILADVIDPGDLSIPRVQRFSQLLLQAIELQKSYPGTWDVMLDNLTRHRMGLNGLNDAKFQWVMEFMSAELKDILRYPQVFDVILGYVTTPDLSFERAQLGISNLITYPLCQGVEK